MGNAFPLKGPNLNVYESKAKWEKYVSKFGENDWYDQGPSSYYVSDNDVVVRTDKAEDKTIVEAILESRGLKVYYTKVKDTVLLVDTWKEDDVLVKQGYYKLLEKPEEFPSLAHALTACLARGRLREADVTPHL